MKKTILSAPAKWLATSLLVAGFTTAGALGDISIQFEGTAGKGNALTSGQAAGAVADANWNVITAGTGTYSGFVDSTDSSVSTSVKVITGTVETSGGDTSANGKLLTGFLGPTSTIFVVSNVPPAYQTSGYSVYVYVGCNANGGIAWGMLSNTSGGIIASNNYESCNITFANGGGGKIPTNTFVQASTTGLTNYANYILFTNLTSPSFYWFGNRLNGSSTIGPAGFQIVPVASPMVANAAATGIGAGSATVGAFVTAGNPLPTVNIYYGTSDGGMTAGNWASSVSLGVVSGGSGTTTLTGLTAGTTYYYTAYAANSNGTAWAASSSSFMTVAIVAPTVTNIPATLITATSAKIGGGDSSIGNQVPTNYIYYGTSDGGTTAGNWASNVLLGTNSSATTTLTGLTPGTTYYYSTFAANSAGGNWATPSASFTTASTVAPTVTNIPATAIGAAAATVGAGVTAGNPSPTVTIYYGTSDGGMTAGSWASSVSLGVQGGVITTPLTGLMQNTTYYYSAFVTNSTGSSWATPSASFTTLTIVAPTVTNIPATGITYTTATIGCGDSSTGNQAPTNYIYYGTSDGGMTAGDWANSINLGTNSPATTSLTSLMPGTTYYYAAFAANSAGGAWAASSASFTTTAYAQPTVTNIPATSVTYTTATVGAGVSSTGGQTPTNYIYYGTSDGGTTAGNWASSVNLGTNSPASANLTGLTAGTTYYYAAFSANSAGGAWAASSAAFTTVAYVLPTVTNTPATSVGVTTATVGAGVTAGSPSPNVTIYYGTSDGGTSFGGWAHSLSLGVLSGGATTNLTGLATGTTYYYTAFATNSAGGAWASPSLSFTTSVPQPPLVSLVAPAPGALYAPGANIGLNAFVLDTNGPALVTNSISINFVGNPAVSTGLLSTDSAGVVPATNWNNFLGTSGTTNHLVDGTGALVGATLTSTFSNEQDANEGTANGNEKLFDGYLNVGGTLTVSNIPYASYNVYVYVGGNSFGAQAYGSIGAVTYYYNNCSSVFGAGGQGIGAQTFVLCTNLSSSVSNNANYLLFTNLSGSSFSFSGNRISTTSIGPAGIQIVDVTDSSTVSSVSFYQGTTLLGSGTAPLYNLAWNSVPAGDYGLTAVASDSFGLTTTSSVVNITVDTPPTVSLTSPTNLAVYPAGTDIPLSANAASTTTATIAGVSFYAGSTLLGTVTSAPYNLTWSGATTGTYSLKAVAADSYGLMATSAVASVTVQMAQASTPTLVSGPSVLANGQFQAGYHGSPSSTYYVDRSTNLSGPWQLNWTNLTSAADGTFEVVDPNSPPVPIQFYRVHP